MRQLLTHEVDAASKAAFQSGADQVIVNDSHGSGYNILFEQLDPRCEIIHGRNCSGPHWLPCIGEGFDALVLVGMHAMGGTRCAVLSHSCWQVNGGEMFLSEASMAAAIGADHGIPTVFVSGDDKLTAELAEKIPGIETAGVKRGLGAYQARSLMPGRACQLIGEGVFRGLARRHEIELFKIPGPVKLNLLDSTGLIPPLKPCRAEDVVADTVDEAFMIYEREMSWTHFDTEVPDGLVFP